jgi:predicted DNA-binding transcriptional regulator AlpA
MTSSPAAGSIAPRRANLKTPEIAAKLGISERSVYRVLADTRRIQKKAD